MTDRYRHALTEPQLEAVAASTRYRFWREAPFLTAQEGSLARQVFIEGKAPAEVAREAGVATSTVYQLCRRVLTRARQLAREAA